MLSQYTWGQFFLFMVVVVVLYYLVVGLMYYRDEFSAILKGKKPTGPQLAGAGAGPSAAGPPSLVRSKSAFVTSPTATESAAGAAAATKEAPEDGAADNLPEASAAVVGGELPSSTATATGRDDSTENEGPMDAASSVAGATDEAVAMDADREEQDDRPNEALAAIIRQKAHEMQPNPSADGSDEGQTDNPVASSAKINTDGANIETKRTLIDISDVEAGNVYQPAVADSYEPLADFNMPVASTLDVAPAQEEELFEVDEVANYILQLQAGEKPSAPAALVGTSLEDELAQFTTTNTDELTNLLGAEAE